MRKLPPVLMNSMCGVLLCCSVFVGVRAASAAEICVTLAGDDEWNGTYNNDSSAQVYEKDASHFLVSDSFTWGFFDNSSGTGSPAYSTGNSSGPAGNSFFVVLGTSPAPTVSSGACVTPTPVPTYTPTVAPTPTPSADSPLPESICLNESDETSQGFAGTYLLLEGSSKTGSFKYGLGGGSSIILESENINIAIDLAVRRDGLTSYFRRVLPNSYAEIPLGSYVSFQETGQQSFYCPNRERSDNVLITEGACSESSSAGTESVPTTSINGTVLGATLTGQSGVVATETDIPELEPGLTYAILFEGLTAEESTKKAPIDFAVTDADGNYTFQDVLPGEYHIVFAGLDAEYNPSEVSVEVVGATSPATAPDTTLSTVSYADEGCTLRVISSDVALVNVAFVTYIEKINAQLTLISDLTQKSVAENKGNSIQRKAAAAESNADVAYGEVLQLARQYPTHIRTSCPDTSGCQENSLVSEQKGFEQLVKRIGKLELKVRKIAERALANKKKDLKQLRKGALAIGRAQKQALKVAAKLPRKHEVCPEVE